jgi:hypothetical protein
MIMTFQSNAHQGALLDIDTSFLEAFVDESWGNDSMPIFTMAFENDPRHCLVMCIDYLLLSERECECEFRFHLYIGLCDASGCYEISADAEDVALLTNDFTALKAKVVELIPNVNFACK